ncbi:MAG: LPS export ABC transporter periplasmic protein LptC [Deltaproteobacteria bacterium]|nr:LPS export ABC transporter periplasmic protein LptC [Deltaproteobacteria bacterium]
MKRHWPLVGVLVLFLAVGFYFAKAGRDFIKTTAFLKDVISGEGVELKDIHYRQDDLDGKIKWALDAKEVRLSEDRKTIRFFDFYLKVEAEGRPGFSLRGEKGIYCKDIGKIELQGELDGSYGTEYRFLTEYVVIDEKKGTVNNEEPVEISGPFFTVKGKGIFADLSENRIKILSNVVTTINQEAGVSATQ